jgi:hypothetical protein
MATTKKTKKKDLNYVVKAVHGTKPSPQKMRRNMIIGFIITINILFLLGFTALFARYAENISNLGTSLGSNIRSANRPDIPSIIKSGLGLVSDSEELFPQVNLAEYDLEQEFSTQGISGTDRYPKPADNTWKIVGIGDFNSDDKTDILWQNQNNNKIIVWYMNGQKVTDIKSMPTIDDKNWKVQAATDINNDGSTDLVWKFNDTKESKILVWFVKNRQLQKQQWLVPDVQDLPDWDILGSGDFDGDKQNDLVFYYKGKDLKYKGALMVNFLENKNDSFVTKESKSTAWLPWVDTINEDGNLIKVPVAVNDFNQDGFPDIMVRQTDATRIRSDQGRVEARLLQDLESLAIVEIPKVQSLDWQFVPLDADKDNNTDFIWYNTNSQDRACQGQTNLWLMTRVQRLKVEISKEISNC